MGVLEQRRTNATGQVYVSIFEGHEECLRGMRSAGGWNGSTGRLQKRWEHEKGLVLRHGSRWGTV